MDSVPTFKKKKRPVGVSNVARPASPIETNAIASTSEEIDTTR